MHKLALSLLLLSALGWAQSNPAEYSLNVHVISSEWVMIPSTIGPLPAQKLHVLLDGKKYQLEADTKGKIVLLALGDYKARLLQDVHKNAYEFSQTYELQFPDKTTRKFYVVRKRVIILHFRPAAFNSETLKL